MDGGVTSPGSEKFIRIVRLGTVEGVTPSDVLGPLTESQIPDAQARLQAQGEGESSIPMAEGDARALLVSLARGEWVVLQGEDGLEARRLARWASEAHVDVWVVWENVYCCGR